MRAGVTDRCGWFGCRTVGVSSGDVDWWLFGVSSGEVRDFRGQDVRLWVVVAWLADMSPGALRHGLGLRSMGGRKLLGWRRQMRSHGRSKTAGDRLGLI